MQSMQGRTAGRQTGQFEGGVGSIGSIGRSFKEFGGDLTDFVGEYTPGIKVARGSYADKILQNTEQIGPFDRNEILGRIGYGPDTRGQAIKYVVEDGKSAGIKIGTTDVLNIENGELQYLAKAKDGAKLQTRELMDSTVLAIGNFGNQNLMGGQNNIGKESQSDGESYRNPSWNPTTQVLLMSEAEQTVLNTPIPTSKLAPTVLLNAEPVNNKNWAFDIHGISKVGSNVPVFADVKYERPGFGPVDVTLPLV